MEKLIVIAVIVFVLWLVCSPSEKEYVQIRCFDGTTIEGYPEYIVEIPETRRYEVLLDRKVYRVPMSCCILIRK